MDSADSYTHFDSNKGIKGVASNFNYPDNAKNLLNNLSEYCVNYANCENFCETHLDKSPILRVSYIAYNIMEFIKE